MDGCGVFLGEVDDCANLTVLFGNDVYWERVGVGESPDNLLFGVLSHDYDLLV